MGFEPMTSVLPRLRATPVPHGPTLHTWRENARRMGGQWRIRTSEALATDLQSVPFVHFGNCPG